MGWTNVHPDFRNGSRKLFHIDSEWLRSRDWKYIFDIFRILNFFQNQEIFGSMIFFLTRTEMPKYRIRMKKLRSRARTSAVSFPSGWYDFWCVSLCGWSLLTGAGEWWGHILSRSSRKIAPKIITKWAPSNIMVTMNTDSREIKTNYWINWEF